jgi:hypothetical protein
VPSNCLFVLRSVEDRRCPYIQWRREEAENGLTAEKKSSAFGKNLAVASSFIEPEVGGQQDAWSLCNATIPSLV